MVYSADGFPKTEAIAPQRRLASLLSNQRKEEYMEMCIFIMARISLVIVRSDTLLLRGASDKEAYILQRLDLADRAVMELILLWQD